MLQVGARGLVQSLFITHWTQRMVVVSHLLAKPPVHCVSAVQETTHRFVVVSQARPASPQSESPTHWTHRLVVVLQCVPPAPAPVQLVSAVHWTQRFVVVLQTVPVTDPAHSAFIVHEMTQRFVVVSQAIPASPQLASLRHCTQAPAVEQ